MITIPAQGQISELLDSANVWQQAGQYQKVCDIVVGTDLLVSISDDANWHALGDLYTSIGVALAQFALRDSANDYYLKSIEAYKNIAASPKREIATSYNNLSFSHARQGAFDLANAFVDSARIYAGYLVGNDSLDVLGNTEFQAGVIHYFQEEYELALPFFRNSLKLRLARDRPFDEKLSHTHNVMANTFVGLGEPDSIKYHFDRVLQILLDIYEPTHPVLATAYSNQGFKYLALNEFEQAKYYFLKSIQIHEKLFGKDYPSLHFAYGGLANAALKVGADESAHQYYLEKFRLVTTESILGVIQSRLNLGVCQYQVKQFAEGLESAKSAERLLIKNKVDATSPLWHSLGFIKGLNASYSNQHDLAISAFETIELNPRNNVADSLEFASAFAQVLTRGEQPHRALKVLNGPYLQFCTTESQEISLDELRIAIAAESNLSEIYISLFRTSQNIEDLHNAISLLRKCIVRIDKLKHNLIVDGNRERVSQRYHPVYESLINGLLTLNRLHPSSTCREEINFYLQKSHNQSLRESRKGREWSRHEFEGHDLLEELHTNNNAIRRLEQSKFEFTRINSEYIDLSFDDQMLDLVSKNEEIKKKIEKHYPKLQDHFFESIPTLKELQRQLSEEEVILNYFYGEDSLLCMLVSKREYGFLQVALGDLEDRIDEFLTAIDLTKGEVSGDSIAQLGYYLYRRLLYPFADLLKEKKDIIIKPAGKLAYVPFSILLSEPVQGQSFKSWPYVLRKFDFSLTTSLSEWVNGRSKKSKKAKQLYAGFAPSYEKLKLSERDRMVDSDFSELVRSGYMPLPRAVKEVTEIGAMMEGTVFSGEEATKHSFQEIASKYQIIHLAMHAITEDENPEYSKLIFSSGQDSTPSMLMSHELYGMDINTELVVLTACNTGLGRLSNGEGINGMARAFSFAGAKSLVMSLWSIPDFTTSEVIAGFFTNLRNGQRKHTALKDAQLTFLKNNQIPKFDHPFYWAGLIQAGSVAPIEFNAFWSIGSTLIVAATIMIFFYLVYDRMLSDNRSLARFKSSGIRKYK